MLIHNDYLTPAELTGYVRAAEADRAENAFSLAQFVPNRPIDDLDYRFTRGGEGLIEAASYRAYDTEAEIGSRPGVTRVQGELPPISRKIRLGEYDRLKQRKAEEDSFTAGLLRDADRLIREISARMEIARGEALQSGKLTLDERGVKLEANFGRRPEHAVSAGTMWSDLATAVPLTDLLAWKDVYSDANGTDPGVILTSRKVMGYLLRNEEMRQLASTHLGAPNIVSVSMLASVLEAHGLPQIQLYDAKVKWKGATKRIIDENRVLMLPPPVDANSFDGTDLGATLWGTTVEAMSADYGIESGEEPGVVAGVYEDKDPIALWTKASAIGMPVLANPDLSFVATVAA